MPDMLDALKNPILRSCFLLCINSAGSLGCVLPLLSPVGALPHALSVSLPALFVSFALYSANAELIHLADLWICLTPVVV